MPNLWPWRRRRHPAVDPPDLSALPAALPSAAAPAPASDPGAGPPPGTATARPPAAAGHEIPQPLMVPFAEYEMYVRSTTDVTQRRAALNRFNYSVSSAILLAIAVIANQAIGEPRVQFAAWCLILALSALAAIFCTYWVAQIDELKVLNDAKFRVINAIAAQATFVGSDGQELGHSFQPFDREWQLLDRNDELLTLPRRRRILGGMIAIPGVPHGFQVLKASSAEYFVAKSFRALFGAVFAAILLVGVFNWSTLSQSINPLSRLG